MNLILSLILLFFAGPNNCHERQNHIYTLTTFTKIPKGLPDDIGDCGTGYYYLSKNDQKNAKLICITDYDVVLIYINNKPLKLKAKGGIYTSGKYSLIIKDGQEKKVGDETWTMKSSIIVMYENKIIWNKDIIGYGGC